MGRNAAPAQPLLPDRSEHGMELLQYVPQADRGRWQMRSKHSARFRIQYSDSDIVDHFQRLGYAVTYDDLAFTTEEVDDFVRARLTNWHRSGNLVTLESHGLLIVERAQPHPRQRSRDVVVVSLGGARVIMGALNPPDRKIGVSRYADTM
jgi:hypothetical protein